MRLHRLAFLAVFVPATAALAAWPELTRPLPPNGGGEKDAALVVGAENYLSVPAVTGAVKNATDWYLYLANVRKVPPSSMTLLRDKDVTAEKLKKFAAQAASQVKPGGTLWFIFIGHGAPARDGKDGVLVGFDAQQDADSLYARSVPQGELMKAFAAGAQGQTVMVVDACFSGRAAGGAPLVPGLQPVIPILETPSQEKGKTVLTLSAGTGEQFAGPLPGTPRPAFSYLVLGALRGWGDANKDGAVTAREAVDYATLAIQATVKDRSQTPQLLGGDGPLARAGKEAGPDLASLVVEKAVAPAVGASTTAAPAPSSGPVAQQARPQAPASGLQTVAVAEFKSRLPPEMAWLGGSIADGLLTQLSRSRQVRVVEREFLEQIVSELKLQGSKMVDATSAVQAGKLLGARLFVVGSVARLDDQVVVRARIINVERGEAIGEQVEVTGSPSKLFALQGQVARAVSQALSLQLALADGAGLETNELAFEAYADIDRLRFAARALPFFGLDPTRSRRGHEFQSMLAITQRLKTSYPRLPLGYQYGALFSLQLEDHDGAQTSAELFRKLAPADVEPLVVLGNVLQTRGDFEGSWKAYVEATTRFPLDSRGWYGLARLQMQRRDNAAAVVSLVGALERQPLLVEAEGTLKSLLGGASGQALVTQVSAVDRRVGTAAGAFRALWESQWGGAAALGAEAIRTSPGLHVGYLLSGLAERNAGNAARAEQLLSAALQLRPDVPETHRELGLLAARLGRCADAQAHVGYYLKKATVLKEFSDLQARMGACRL